MEPSTGAAVRDHRIAVRDRSESLSAFAGIRSVADDIAEIKRDMATKDQIIALHTQVNSIERQLREMNHVKLEDRVADLEEKVFGKVRA